MTTHQGSFDILPGLTDAAAFTLQCLDQALLELIPLGDVGVFAGRAHHLILAGLLVSQEVVKRADLDREAEPKGALHEPVVVPPAPRLKRLECAVAFTERELSLLLRQHGVDLDDLAPLIADLGSSEVQPSDALDSAVLRRPIVRQGGR